LHLQKKFLTQYGENRIFSLLDEFGLGREPINNQNAFKDGSHFSAQVEAGSPG
jgi:hypothetical protein